MITLSECGKWSRRRAVQLIVLWLFAILLNNANSVECLKIKNVNASLENAYRFNIVGGEKHYLVYTSGAEDGGSTNESQKYMIMKYAMKVVCTAHYTHDPECPLIVAVTQKSSLVFWTIAAENSSTFLGNGTIISSAERSVILDDDSLENMMFSVALSTCSKSVVNYTLSVHLRNDLLIPRKKLTRTQIMPSSPAVYYFPQLKENVNSRSQFLFIQLAANPDSCMIMSIQQPNGPMADKVETVIGHGQWQTVSSKTAMTIPVEDYPAGFFIVFVLLPDDTWCNHGSLGQPEIQPITSNILKTVPSVQPTIRRKSIRFTVRNKRPTSDFTFAIFSPLVILILYISSVFIVHLRFHQRRCQLAKNSHSPVCTHHSSTTASTTASYNPRFEIVSISQQCAGKMCGSTDSIVRSRIQISELINSRPERLMVQSRRYFFAGLLSASFYCVPVFQLLLSYYKRLQETGNMDLCYYNYMCANTLGVFYDFNHIYSNIGYVVCGLGFMSIVFVRQTMVETLLPGTLKEDLKTAEFTQTRWWPKAHWDISKGVFVHHGLFYAMGFSLFMTGLMSSAYHICPNQSNFQFDTVFMYTIAAIGCLTIYTFRHPTYVSAGMTFMALAIVAASTVVGLLWESSKFRILFTVTHIIFVVIILVYIHYVGYVRVNGVTITEWKPLFSILRQKWCEDIKKCHVFCFQNDVWSPEDSPDTLILPGPCRMIFPILVLVVNSAALTMIWTMMPTTNFASQVLAVYVINCSCYTVYYTIMKMVHYECRGTLWIQPAIYLTLTAVLWTWALSYFGDEVTLWERSPAESRAKNADCVFLEFYDSHDVWHFLSASALFSSLMSLLTMDDDLMEKSKSEIPVF